MFTCPVCGYGGLRHPPNDHVICPSCGVQFGYNDAGPLPLPEMHRRLRQRWIRRGAQWQSTVIARPRDWNAWLQLIDARYGCDITWLGNISITQTPTFVRVAPQFLGTVKPRQVILQ